MGSCMRDQVLIYPNLRCMCLHVNISDVAKCWRLGPVSPMNAFLPIAPAYEFQNIQLAFSIHASSHVYTRIYATAPYIVQTRAPDPDQIASRSEYTHSLLLQLLLFLLSSILFHSSQRFIFELLISMPNASVCALFSFFLLHLQLLRQVYRIVAVLAIRNITTQTQHMHIL